MRVVPRRVTWVVFGMSRWVVGRDRNRGQQEGEEYHHGYRQQQPQRGPRAVTLS